MTGPDQTSPNTMTTVVAFPVLHTHVGRLVAAEFPAAVELRGGLGVAMAVETITDMVGDRPADSTLDDIHAAIDAHLAVVLTQPRPSWVDDRINEWSDNAAQRMPAIAKVSLLELIADLDGDHYRAKKMATQPNHATDIQRPTP